MTLLQGSKADDLTPQFGATVLMPNVPLNVTGSTQTIPNFKLDLTITGLYFMTATLHGNVEIGEGDSGLILASFLITPLGETPFVITPTIMVAAVHQTSVTKEATTTLTALFQITGTTTIELQVVRAGTGSPIFVTSQIVSDPNLGQSNLSAIQLIN